jgi:phenylacetic acid degradation operon negative regulatory protein
MLPDNWPGHAARELCGRIYWKVFDASETHLDVLAGKDNERYAPLKPDVDARFGGRPAN